MSLQVEKLEKNMAKLTIEVSAEDLEKAIQNAYKKQRNSITQLFSNIQYYISSKRSIFVIRLFISSSLMAYSLSSSAFTSKITVLESP